MEFTETEDELVYSWSDNNFELVNIHVRSGGNVDIYKAREYRIQRTPQGDYNVFFSFVNDDSMDTYIFQRKVLAVSYQWDEENDVLFLDPDPR